MKLFTGSISGISSACPTAFLITLNPKPERINAKIKLITIPINNTAPLSTPNVGKTLDIPARSAIMPTIANFFKSENGYLIESVMI